jgi:hypothetical protein
MPAKKPKAKTKSSGHEKPVKIEGTFDDLIRRSLAAKKPKGGWPKSR